MYDDMDDQPGIIHSDDQSVVLYPDGRKSVHFKKDGVYTRELITLSVDNSLLEEKRHDTPDGLSGTIKKYDEDTGQLTTMLVTAYDPANRRETCHLTFSLDDPEASQEKPLIGINHYAGDGQLYKVSSFENGQLCQTNHLSDFIITESHTLDTSRRISSYQDGDHSYRFRNADHDEKTWQPYGELTVDDVDILTLMMQEARIMEVIEFDEGEASFVYDAQGRFLLSEVVMHDEERDMAVYKVHLANPETGGKGGIEYLINATKNEIVDERMVDESPAGAVLTAAALEIFQGNNEISVNKSLPPSPWSR